MTSVMTTTPEVRAHLAGILSGHAQHRSQVCPIHGDFGSIKMPNGQWSGCPACTLEESQAQSQVEQRARSVRASTARLEQLRGESMIPRRFQGKRLEDYVVDPMNQKQAQVLAYCQHYVATFEERLAAGAGMVMLGSVGTGKSHLAYAIGNALLDQGRRVMGIDVYELIDLIKEQAFNQKGGSERAAIKGFVGDLDLLILDEVGAQLGTDWERLTLFKVVNERYKQQLPTIMISNLAKPQLNEYIGERIVDRMREGGGAIFNLGWESYRGRREGQA